MLFVEIGKNGKFQKNGKRISSTITKHYLHKSNSEIKYKHILIYLKKNVDQTILK